MKRFCFVGNCNWYDCLVIGQRVVQFSLIIYTGDKQIGFPLWSSTFVTHSYDYRPNWTPLSPITIINYLHFKSVSMRKPVRTRQGGDTAQITDSAQTWRKCWFW